MRPQMITRLADLDNRLLGRDIDERLWLGGGWRGFERREFALAFEYVSAGVGALGKLVVYALEFN